jgi:hypothetical protein
MKPKLCENSVFVGNLSVSGKTLLKRGDSGCMLLLSSCYATLQYALLRFKVNKNWKLAERNEIARSWEILGLEFLCLSEYKTKISRIEVTGVCLLHNNKKIIKHC